MHVNRQTERHEEARQTPHSGRKTHPVRSVVDAGPVFRLQRTLGNRAVTRMVQRKPLLSEKGNRFEREADRLADALMSMPAGRSAPGRDTRARRLTPPTPIPQTTPAPRTIMRATADELAAAGTYPTSDERARLQSILNPQQQQARQQGRVVPPVTDEPGFRTAMSARMNTFINRYLVPARARQASSVVLGLPAIQSLGDIAQREVNRFYRRYIGAAVHTPAEQQRRAGYRLRRHLHLIPTRQTAQTDTIARDWVASRMRQHGNDIISRFNVLGSEGQRDAAVFNRVRDHILAQRLNDLRIIIYFYPGFERGGEAYIQGRLAPEYPGQSAQQTERRGRWDTLGGAIHEMLHALAHERFTNGVEGLEESGIAVEGFAEYLTRPVYASLGSRARGDRALRASIHGTASPYVSPPSRTRLYRDYFSGVERIVQILGGNSENVKIAFFLGRLEYLGLGGWNAGEAARRRYPGNMLSGAALLTTDENGFFRIDYGRIVYGRGARFQIHLGGGLNYLTQGQRLGITGMGALRYQWPNVYVGASLSAGASTSATQALGNSVRLDLIPGVEAGVRIGIARVGVRANLLIPIYGGPADERVVRLGAGVGLSFDF